MDLETPNDPSSWVVTDRINTLTNEKLTFLGISVDSVLVYELGPNSRKNQYLVVKFNSLYF